MYCGKYAKTPQGGEDSFLYVAMNMHWEPQKLAFPKLPKGMEWNLVLATEKAEDTLTVQEKEEQSREQTGIIAPRSFGKIFKKENRCCRRKMIERNEYLETF